MGGFFGPKGFFNPKKKRNSLCKMLSRRYHPFKELPPKHTILPPPLPPRGLKVPPTKPTILPLSLPRGGLKVPPIKPTSLSLFTFPPQKKKNKKKSIFHLSPSLEGG